jgi:hypothetical protein
MELFVPATIHDTCTNAAVEPDPCSFEYPGLSSGKFTDHTRVGCPHGPGCGYKIWPNHFARCFPEGTHGGAQGGYERLGSVFKDVRGDYAAINGNTTSLVNQHIYACCP